MENLSEYLNDLRKRYRDIFLQCSRDVNNLIYALKPESFSGEIFEKYPEASEGRLWQNNAIKTLQFSLSKELNDGFSKMKKYYSESGCIGCGTCCKLACSEFSPEELEKKAKNGDSFAQQFIQTFVPYLNTDEVEKVFPQYLKMLKDNNESGYYFYHCPKVTEDNKCPDYSNRPQICRDFPDNPIAFLPLSCGYMDWKLKSEHISLKLNAESEIIHFYIDKIKGLYEE